MKVGHIALIGRPNVGKSTLLNHLVGQKVSIISRKPQTTRHRILGIKTDARGQLVFVDTPGVHSNRASALNHYMNRVAATACEGVDVVIWMIDRPAWSELDALIKQRLTDVTVPVILAINKIDKLADRESLLPFLDAASREFQFHALFPLSALKHTNLSQLEDRLFDLVPEGDAIYPEEYVTDRSERFLASEIIREKLIRALGQELPYATTVEIDSFRELSGLTRIHATIWVERDGQKVIVVGKGGEVMRKIGERARKDLEVMLDTKVYLNLWVKVKRGWSDDLRALQQLGYRD